MSLEQALAANTAAIEALTAALQAGGSVPAATTTEKPASTGKTTRAAAGKTTKASKPAHTPEECQAVLIKIKDEHGIEHAKEILAEHGIDKMANIKADQADAVFASAEAKYAELSAGGDEGDEGDGL